MFGAFMILTALVLLLVFSRKKTSRRHGARFEPDPRALRALQAKRRLALRRLGDRWVLHSSRPPVKWGVARD